MKISAPVFSLIRDAILLWLSSGTVAWLRRIVAGLASWRPAFDPCTFGICGVKTCTGTGFFPRTSRFPCQYHSTIAPYSFIHLPPTMYNVFLPALQFSPVYHSTIVPYHSHVSECEVTSAPPCTIILTKLLAQHKINSSGQQQCSWNVTLHGSCT